MVEIDMQEYRYLVGAETALGIIRRMINDEDHESKFGNIDTKTLRQVIGMAGVEHEGD